MVPLVFKTSKPCISKPKIGGLAYNLAHVESGTILSLGQFGVKKTNLLNFLIASDEERIYNNIIM